MANCKKYNRAACGHMFKHYERAKDENGEYIKFGNQEIDTTKSHLNYNLAAAIQPDWQGTFVKRRCSEVKMQKRADVNVMCSWLVTAPKDVQADETDKFFQETYKFLSERYGVNNVVSAHVHMDETTPHVHFAFVPVVECKKKNILKVSAKECIDKKELNIFHKDLSAYMEKIFGRDIGVLNEMTKDGDKSIEELKRGTARQELENIEHQTAEIKKEGADVTQELKELEDKKVILDKQIKGLRNKFKGEQLTIKEIGKIKPIKNLLGGVKNVTVEDIENLKVTATKPLQSAEVLNNLKQEIKELKTENAEQKKKIPTMAQELSRNQEKIELQDRNNKLASDYKVLRELYNKLLGAVNQLPAEAIEFVRGIVEPPKPPQKKKLNTSHDDR